MYIQWLLSCIDVCSSNCVCVAAQDEDEPEAASLLASTDDTVSSSPLRPPVPSSPFAEPEPDAEPEPAPASPSASLPSAAAERSPSPQAESSADSAGQEPDDDLVLLDVDFLDKLAESSPSPQHQAGA